MRGPAPYRTIITGGSYGGYIMMIGNWAYWLGCRGGFLARSSANSAQANFDYRTFRQGIGTGAYWFMGGPGVDPHYNGTTVEAFRWGARQAARAVSDLRSMAVSYRVVFMDVELPGIAPAPDNGWKDVYTSSCSGVVKSADVPAAVDRADFNGFWDYLRAHSHYVPGVYSAPAVWQEIFGAGAVSQIPHTIEWTYEPETVNLHDAPVGWCLAGTTTCAQFFGGVASTSAEAVMWQWSGGGGVRNPYGDFDQIDTRFLP